MSPMAPLTLSQHPPRLGKPRPGPQPPPHARKVHVTLGPVGGVRKGCRWKAGLEHVGAEGAKGQGRAEGTTHGREVGGREVGGGDQAGG